MLKLKRFLKPAYPTADRKSATVKYVSKHLVKFLISGSLANDTNITTAPIIDKLELIPLIARVQSGMVALARPMNGDAVTDMFSAGESVMYVIDILRMSSLFTDLEVFMSLRFYWHKFKSENI